MSPNRRAFLRAGLLAPTAVALAQTKAFAFTVEDGGTDVSALYEAARTCSLGNDPQHQKLLADLRQSLDALALSSEERQALVAGLSCPLCGCSLKL